MMNDKEMRQLLEKLNKLIDERETSNGSLSKVEVSLGKLETKVENIEEKQGDLNDRVNQILGYFNDPARESASLREHIANCPARDFYESKESMTTKPEMYEGLQKSLIIKMLLINGGMMVLVVALAELLMMMM